MTTAVGYLDGPRLRRCLLAGLQKLISEREHLNLINVFPVPDGDTGNNLAQTALAAQQALADHTEAAVGEMLTRLADGALDGAQGNSGAILAQFFQGLATRLQDNVTIDTAELAAAFSSAAVYTRSALTSPREGTIITVIDAAAAAAQSGRRSGDFAKLLQNMLVATRAAVQATTGQLEELRRAKVVDAGASGFCSILEGCVDYLQHGSLREEPVVVAETLAPLISHHLPTEALTFRYCTECMVVGEALDAAAIRQELFALGDSMVIAGSPKRLRIHIHSNEPESIFDLVAEYGTVQNTKADDMVGQARSLNRTDRDVAIVTDSAADIPESVMSELDIHMVPLRVQFGEESHLDKCGMSPAEFRAELARNPNAPGTSQPTQGDSRRMYEFLGTHFKEILTVSLSASLSGTYQGAVAAAQRVAASDRISVVDSRNISVGQGLIAAHAARLAQQGMRGEKLRQTVTEASNTLRTFALIADLTNAVRSGRIKPTLKHIADWLHLTPVLASKPDGKVGMSGVLPGRRRLVQRFARHVTRQIDPARRWEFAIAHGYAEAEDAELLSQEVRSLLPESRCVWQTELGTALGVHAGMEALVIAFRDLSADQPSD